MKTRGWIGVLILIAFCSSVGVQIVDAVIGPQSESPSDPDAGLSDEERMANHANARAEFDQKYREWIANLDVSALDLRALPRGEYMASYGPPFATLTETAMASSLIAIVRVNDVTALEHGMRSTLTVERVLKGEAANTIVYRQGASFEPTPDWMPAIAESAGYIPMLFPGDRVLMFLNETEPGLFDVAGGATAIYLLEGSRVTPLERNPFASQFAGKTESEAIAIIQVEIDKAP